MDNSITNESMKPTTKAEVPIGRQVPKVQKSTRSSVRGARAAKGQSLVPFIEGDAKLAQLLLDVVSANSMHARAEALGVDAEDVLQMDLEGNMRQLYIWTQDVMRVADGGNSYESYISIAEVVDSGYAVQDGFADYTLLEQVCTRVLIDSKQQFIVDSTKNQYWSQDSVLNNWVKLEDFAPVLARATGRKRDVVVKQLLSACTANVDKALANDNRKVTKFKYWLAKGNSVALSLV